MTEDDWLQMMQEVVRQTRRILKPTGSAVFILQPNSEKVGKMRPWLFKFQAWCCEEWNIVQDVYWWNINAMPTAHTQRKNGLMRGSIKLCIWLGNEDCYRKQDAILWDESQENARRRLTARAGRVYTPSGHNYDKINMTGASLERGGVTPFNILPISPTQRSSGGSFGHGASTPQALTDWWTRYLCPPGGVVADWFCGTGTSGLSAAKYGNSFIGIEKMPKYYAIAKERLGV
jgi:DNA modification methylase